MINTKLFNANLSLFENETKAGYPLASSKQDIKQDDRLAVGAYKTAKQISAKGEIYLQRIWWA